MKVSCFIKFLSNCYFRTRNIGISPTHTAQPSLSHSPHSEDKYNQSMEVLALRATYRCRKRKFKYKLPNQAKNLLPRLMTVFDIA